MVYWISELKRRIIPKTRMQNRVCRTLVIFSYLVFFTMFLLFTNQYNLLLRFMGKNLVKILMKKCVNL